MTGLPPSAHWPTRLPVRKPLAAQAYQPAVCARQRRTAPCRTYRSCCRPGTSGRLATGRCLIEILNPDGTMARMPELQKVSARFGIKIIAIRDLIAYRLKQESMVERGPEVDMPTDYGHFRDITFRQTSNGLEHVHLSKENGNRTNRF